MHSPSRVWASHASDRSCIGLPRLHPRTNVARERSRDQVSLVCAADDWKRADCKPNYILKPRASARGIGIKLVSDPEKLAKTTDAIVQTYIERPHLINKTKYDLRLYVLVTSFDPLRVYLYREGLARFCSEAYDTNVKRSGKHLYKHLTNYRCSDGFECVPPASALEFVP